MRCSLLRPKWRSTGRVWVTHRRTLLGWTLGQCRRGHAVIVGLTTDNQIRTNVASSFAQPRWQPCPRLRRRLPVGPTATVAPPSCARPHRLRGCLVSNGAPPRVLMKGQAGSHSTDSKLQIRPATAFRILICR